MSSRKLSRQIVAFIVVGTAVFLFQAVLVEIGARLVGPIWAQIIVFPFAVTLAWFWNRRFTFGTSKHSVTKEWLRYILANGFGWIISNSIYFFLVLHFHLIHQYPITAVAAGTLAGMVFNFSASRWLVFGKK